MDQDAEGRVAVGPDGRRAGGAGRVLMLVENLSVPTDRRVWQECVALRDAGFEVVVICPTGTSRDPGLYELREGIAIHRYRPAPSAGGVIGYVREYARAFAQTRRLSRKLARAGRFDVVHAANPPDFLLHAARGLRRDGSQFIFDHHDLSPELYESRYRRRDLPYRVLLALERAAFRSADVVISTNESYKRVAVERGQKAPDDVFVVRNGPDPGRFTPGPPDPSLKNGREFLIAYVGMMGPQDGIEDALLALRHLFATRSDWRAVFVGDGDVLPRMRALAFQLGLGELVEFTGLVEEADVLRVLSTADVCLAPEPSNPLNDVSTMIKVAEYMAMARPIVAYDLPETRATAQGAAVYATSGDPSEFARRISLLLSDRDRRSEMGTFGRRRVEQELSWKSSVPVLLAAYERVLSHGGRTT